MRSEPYGYNSLLNKPIRITFHTKVLVGFDTGDKWNMNLGPNEAYGFEGLNVLVWVFFFFFLYIIHMWEEIDQFDWF